MLEEIPRESSEGTIRGGWRRLDWHLEELYSVVSLHLAVTRSITLSLARTSNMQPSLLCRSTVRHRGRKS